ncbi:geranylgeranyl reductase family protein [Luteimicrobium subarcticum]|uniref:Geranylgeranyl reductase family protein n=1 Tax=Luteimicrobium subarcticum TaxID=620910 RepID=A0A2M8WVP5_9MICO|nr:geranylgeranyl reductase family protein [Luteimicrobium subarcticum]PJI94992.1 geranylgeranyl reductase family protein [Luteimicrobium subarcticum]
MTAQVVTADVVVVGAGPAGSAAAHYAASAGLDVVLLERAAFPRDKVCGDGLTPRAVGELVRMGVATDDDRWSRVRGLRLVADDRAFELPWPELASFPSYGLALARTSLDEVLARHAAASGARLVERTAVRGPALDERSGRVVGVVARPLDDAGRAAGPDVEYRAPVVVAADGVSSRLAVAVGLTRREDRPLGVAVRTYYRVPAGSPWHGGPAAEWMESHVRLWAGEPRRSAPLPGYGWLFPLADGTVNVGLGSVHSTPARQSAAGHDYRDALARWTAGLPPEWGLTPGHRVGPVRAAALPMGLNRSPLASRGLLLVGDAAGMVSPFNGEGIGYGMQAGRLAAEAAADALASGSPAARERALTAYDARVRAELGGFYTLGRWFTRLIEQPALQRVAVEHGLPRRAVMDVVLRLFADSYEPHGGDWVDRVVATAARWAPAA